MFKGHWLLQDNKSFTTASLTSVIVRIIRIPYHFPLRTSNFDINIICLGGNYLHDVHYGNPEFNGLGEADY